MNLFVDVTDTFRNNRKTGVQRVVTETARQLVQHEGCTLIRFDSRIGQYRPLSAEAFFQRKESEPPEPKRGRRLNGWLVRWGLYRPLAFLVDGFRRWFVYPFQKPGLDLSQGTFFTAEIVGDRARTLALQSWCRQPGFKLIVLVHDLIPWSHPHLALLHPGDFRRSLSVMDRANLLLAVSDSTAGEWRRREAARSPGSAPVVRIYPGGPRLFEEAPHLLGTVLPLFVCVGTVEPRKKQEFLLTLLAELWDEGCRFSFTFAGTLSAKAGGFATRVKALQSAGRPLTWSQGSTDAEIDDLYRSAVCSVYLSPLEGFGLPVLESVARGTPCLAGNAGAVGEVAEYFGGCVSVDPDDGQAIKSELRRFIGDPTYRSQLIATLRKDRLRSWKDWAEDFQRSLRENSL